jgi:hypothetical protein
MNGKYAQAITTDIGVRTRIKQKYYYSFLCG